MQKISRKTRIIIYMTIVVVVIVIGAAEVLSQRSGGESLLGEKLELGQQYLVELSYDKAVLEFTDAINIESKSADAYIGLAEAYKGLGDTEKARGTLEKGYELTGDERIKALLEELDKAEGVAETTVAETTTTETTTVETTTVETTTTAEITTTAVQPREYTNDELVEAVRFLIKDPDANVDQALLDSITEIYICGDELISFEYLIPGSWDDDEFTVYYGDGNQKTYKYGHINDLQFLKRMHNVKTLQIGCNEINDISPISELTNLTEMSLYNNQISDINPLSGLTNLTKMSLYGNKISDISPLSGLINLTNLNLGSNQISDISPLSGLKSLRYLQMPDNKISDIKPLSGLINLSVLILDSNQISDISPLFELTNLRRRLTLSNNPISQTDLDKLKDALPNCHIDT